MKLTTISLSFIIIIILSLFLKSAIYALDYKTADTFTLSTGTSVVGTYVVTANTIDIQGKVDGDLFCAGQDVKISGPVTGNIFCISDTINIASVVDRNIYLLGRDITVSPQASISGEAVIVGQDLVVSGFIKGDLTYAGQKASASSVIVTGQTRFLNSPTSYDFHEFLNFITSVIEISRFIAIFIIGLLFIRLFTEFFENSFTILKNNLKQSLITGIYLALVGIVITIFVIILLFSLVGIPLAVMFYMIFSLFLVISEILLSIYIGRIFIAKANIYMAFTLGMLIIVIVSQAPFIGPLLTAGLLLLGTGAVYQGLKLHRHVST